jgi:hypothetical protein
MTSHDLPFLESDRIIFKIYACEEHLKNIKNIKSRYGDLLAKRARINAELEIDSLISQIIGVFDSLLLKINDKFHLGISSDRIDIDRVLIVLSSETKEIELAHDLEQVNHAGNLYWMVKRLRNYSLQGSLLSADPSVLMSGSAIVYPEVIPYFEQVVHQLREFIENIMKKEPVLL